MRKTVVVLAAAMVAFAGFGLWTTRHHVSSDDLTEVVKAASVGAAIKPSTSVAATAPVMTATPPIVARPRAPLNRFLSGDDLWGAYQALRGSTNGGELWVAETIVRGCFFMTRPGGIVSQLVAKQALIVFDPMTQEEEDAFEAGTGKARSYVEKATDDQVAAAREILMRCGPFVAMTGVEYRAAVDDAMSRRRHADDPVAIAEAMGAHRLSITDERLRRVLASQDPTAKIGRAHV